MTVSASATPIHKVQWPITAPGQAGLAPVGRLALPIMPYHLTDNGNEMVVANRELPPSGYALEVDGRLKCEFATRDGARAGGEELKKRFPMLQIKIYDAQTHAREDI